MDSGASLHFTGDRNDFTYFQDGDFGESETANGLAKITGKGVIFIKHTVELEDGSEYEKVSHLEPVYYMPKLTIRLLSMRSEERRVGKECRSRRSPYNEKKKDK